MTIGGVGRRREVRDGEAITERDEEIRHELAADVVSSTLGAAPAPDPARLESDVGVRLGRANEDHFDPTRTDVHDDEPPEAAEPEQVHPHFGARSYRIKLKTREAMPMQVLREPAVACGDL